MDASEKDCARLTPDAVFVMAGQIALEPVPHRRALALSRIGVPTLWQRGCRCRPISTRAVGKAVRPLISLKINSADRRERRKNLRRRRHPRAGANDQTVRGWTTDAIGCGATT